MTDTKLEDYLAGRTPRCPGYDIHRPCGERVLTIDALLKRTMTILRLSLQNLAASGSWSGPSSITYTRPSSVQQQNAKNVGILKLVPAAACCTMTETCKAAREIWGNDGGHARGKVFDYVRHSGESPHLRP